MVGELSIRVVNEDEVKAALLKVQRELPNAVRRALFAGGLEIGKRAVEKINQGSPTGRLYETHFFTDKQGRLRKGRKRSTPHRASAPGQPPAADGGALASSIKVDRKKNGDLVLIRSGGGSVFYAVLLEFGTPLSGGRILKERPFMRPSFEEVLPGLKKELRKAIQKDLRRLGK